VEACFHCRERIYAFQRLQIGETKISPDKAVASYRTPHIKNKKGGRSCSQAPALIPYKKWELTLAVCPHFKNLGLKDGQDIYPVHNFGGGYVPSTIIKAGASNKIFIPKQGLGNETTKKNLL